MHDAPLVSGADGVDDRNRVPEKLGQRQPFRRYQSVDRLPLDDLHRQESYPRAFLHRVDRNDVRMVESCDRFRFVVEARAPLGVGGKQIRKDLECDVATQPAVARALDLTHTAGATAPSPMNSMTPGDTSVAMRKPS